MAGPAGSFMDPTAWEDPNQLASIDPMVSQGAPAPTAPVPAPPASNADLAAAYLGQQPAGPVNAYTGQPLTPPPAPPDPDKLARTLMVQAATGQPLDQEAYGMLPDEYKAQVRDFAIAQPQQVQVPYSPGRPGGYQPTSRSSSETYTPGTPERLQAADALAQSQAELAVQRAQLQKKRLEAQFQQARNQEAQLAEQANERKALLQAQQEAADRDLAKVRDLSDKALSARVDPGRAFRNNPLNAIAAVLADFFMAKGGRVELAKTVTNLVDRDIDQQVREYQMAGEKAQNAYSAWVREWDGDLKKAELSLKDTQLAMLEQQSMAQAAAMGLEQLPMDLMSQIQAIEAERLKTQDQLAQNAKVQASESFSYQKAIAPSGGGTRQETPEEVLKRLKTENALRDEQSRLDTGKTRAELYDEEKKASEAALARTAEAQQMTSEDRKALGEALAKIVSSDLAAKQWAESTGGQFNPQTGKFEWSEENMPGYAGGVLAPINRATGIQKLTSPLVSQAETNAVDAFARLRTGAVVNESEIPQFKRILLGPQGSERQVQSGINLMAREGIEKRKILEAAYGEAAVNALYEEMLRQRQAAPEPPTVEPR